jgi:hypothetical protein
MEKIFPNGLIYKLPRPDAPKWVKGSLSIKVDEFAEFLMVNQKNGWVNLDFLESKEKPGKLYFVLNDWEPNKQ